MCIIADVQHESAKFPSVQSGAGWCIFADILLVYILFLSQVFNMKKSLLAAALMSLFLTACGDKPANTAADAASAASAAATEAASAATEAAASASEAVASAAEAAASAAETAADAAASAASK